MATRATLEKNLGAVEDLLLGEGTAVQSRNGVNYTVTKIGAKSLPYEDNGDPLVPNPTIFDTLGFPKKAVGINIKGSTLSSILSHTESAGVIDGCTLTNNLPTSVDITSGTALMRVAAASNSDIHTVEVDAISITDLPDNTTSYIIASYTGDGLTNATISHTTDASVATINMTNKVAMYVITRQGNDLYIINVLAQNVDFIAKHQRKLFDTNPFEYVSGSAISTTEVPALYMTVTPGSYYYQSTRIDAVGLVMSSVPGDTIDTYYGTNGSYVRTVGVDTITTQYDVNGTLTTIPLNWFSVQWVYLIADTEGAVKYAIMYGKEIYQTVTKAKEEAIISDIPDILKNSAILIGRLIVTNDAIADSESRFTSAFTAAGVAEHSALAGVQGGTGSGATAEQYHMTALEHDRALKRAATTIPHMSNATLVSGLADGDTSTFIPGTTNLKSIPQSFSIPNNCETLLTTGLEGLVLETDVSITLGTNASLRII